MKLLKNTKILFFFNLCITMSLYAPIEVIYLKNLGLSISQISIANLLTPIVIALMDIPTGVLSDYLGRRKVLFLSGFSFFLSMLILLLAGRPYWVFAAYILEGLGWSFYSANTDSIVVEDSLRHNSNVSKQLAIFYAGLSYGPVISGVISSTISLTSGVVDFKLLILISAIIRLVLLGLAQAVEITQSAEFAAEKKLPPHIILADSFNTIKSDLFGISVALYEASGRLIFYLPVIAQPLFLKNGISLPYFGLIYAFSQLIQGLIQAQVDKIVDRFGIRRILQWSPIIISIGLAAFLIPNPIASLIGLIILQGINPIRGQCLVLQKNKVIGDKIRATYLSSISMMVLVANALYLSFIGSILETHFYASLGIMIAVTCVVGLTLYRNVVEVRAVNYKVVEAKG